MKKCIAVYLRLSLEDVDKRTNQAKDESNSIAAQRQLIQRHIALNPYLSGLPQMEFCDDGFSGTNFQRPDFQRMIDLIRDGNIQIVIVKDLSRFGRDYLEVGDYLEHIFPFLGVRMISINDHYDSEQNLGNTAGDGRCLQKSDLRLLQQRPFQKGKNCNAGKTEGWRLRFLLSVWVQGTAAGEA